MNDFLKLCKKVENPNLKSEFYSTPDANLVLKKSEHSLIKNASNELEMQPIPKFTFIAHEKVLIEGKPVIRVEIDIPYDATEETFHNLDKKMTHINKFLWHLVCPGSCEVSDPI